MTTLKQILDEFDKAIKLYPNLAFEIDRLRMAGGIDFKQFISQKIKQVLEDARPKPKKMISCVHRPKCLHPISLTDYDKKVRKILGEDV